MENSKENLNEISQIVEKMVDELGFRNLPEEELEDFRSNMELQINKRLGIIILENLNDEGMDEYEKVMSEQPLPDPEKIQALTKKYIPDLEEKVKVGMEQFFKEIVDGYLK